MIIAGSPGATAGWWPRIRPYLRRHRGLMIATTVLAVLHIGAIVSLPLGQRLVIDDIVGGRGHRVGPLLVGLCGLAAFQFLMSASWRVLNGRFSFGVQGDVRSDFYDRLQGLDATGHARLRNGQLISRASTDLRLTQQLVSWLPIITANATKVAVEVAVMFVLSPVLAVVVIAVVLGSYLVIRRQRVRVYAAGWDGQQREAEMTTEVEEAVTGVRVVRAFGQEAGETSRLSATLRHLYASRVREIRLRAPFLANLQASPLVGQVLVLGIGGLLAIDGHVTVGTFLAFSGYLADLAATARTLGSIATSMPMAQAAVERVGEVLDLRPVVTDRPHPVSPAVAEGRVELRDVTFAYADSPTAHPVLDGFTLTVSPGETVALVGPAGSGKSTALALIPRFYDATAGTVTVDGIDVREQPQHELRGRTSVVFEDAFLFTDTVAANIAYGRPGATRAEVEDAARAAAAHEFITGLDEGYDTVVGEQGLTLSGGQRQRITLARALIARPEILLLDDATSSVDVAVERQIFAALRPLLAGRTTIMVAYRESTVRLADRVVLIDAGRVVDSGSHEQLLARSALYRDLFGDEPAADDAVASLLPDARAGRFLATTHAWRREEAERDALASPLAGAPPAPNLRRALDSLPPALERAGLDERAETTRDDHFSLRSFILSWRAALLTGLAFVLVDAACGLGGPLLIRHGVDSGMVAGSRAALLATCAAYAGVVGLLRWTMQMEVLYTNRTSERMLFALRLRLQGQLQRLGIDYYDRTQAGRIMTRMTSDVDTVSDLLRVGLVNLVVSFVSFAGMAVVCLLLDWRLALLVLAILPPTAAVTAVYRRVAAPAYDDARERQSMLTASIAEALAGMRITQAFRRESANLRAYRDLGATFIRSSVRGSNAVGLYVAAIEMLTVLAVTLVLGVGGQLVEDRRIQLGVLLAFLLYLAQVFAPVQQMSTVFDLYQRAKTGLRRISELLEVPSSTPRAGNVRPLPAMRGDLRLDGVRLRYSGTQHDALRTVDLHVPAGQRLAFVGRTGAGKSTLAKLVTRFYDPTAGRVLIDGVPLTAVDPAAYRARLGYVPQEPFLFSRSIRDNISYGRGMASDSEVEAAARAVGAHAFIERLPGGYHHRVTERGRSISAGERQLVCLARALLVDPAVLVLDEATSNLDLASERRVNRAMRTASAGRTTLVVAHRPQSLLWTDRVVVVADGRIAEDTTPEDYLRRLHGSTARHEDSLHEGGLHEGSLRESGPAAEPQPVAFS